MTDESYDYVTDAMWDRLSMSHFELICKSQKEARNKPDKTCMFHLNNRFRDGCSALDRQYCMVGECSFRKDK